VRVITKTPPKCETFWRRRRDRHCPIQGKIVLSMRAHEPEITPVTTGLFDDKGLESVNFVTGFYGKLSHSIHYEQLIKVDKIPCVLSK
jgi:hypothetical protein